MLLLIRFLLKETWHCCIATYSSKLSIILLPLLNNRSEYIIQTKNGFIYFKYNLTPWSVSSFQISVPCSIPFFQSFRIWKSYFILHECVSQCLHWPEMRRMTPSSFYHGNFKEPEQRGDCGRSDGLRSRWSSLRKNAPNTSQNRNSECHRKKVRCSHSWHLYEWITSVPRTPPGSAAAEITKRAERAAVVRCCHLHRKRTKQDQTVRCEL